MINQSYIIEIFFFNNNLVNEKLYDLNFIFKCTSLVWLCGLVGVLGYKWRRCRGYKWRRCRSTFAAGTQLG